MAFTAITGKSATSLIKPTDYESSWSHATEEVIQERIDELGLPFKVQYTTHVREEIKDYLTAGYKQTQYILGRSSLYFPIFEHYLNLYELPKELKYLPIVESALRPDVQSGVGAVGLWQFMDFTGEQYRLRINDYVDERRDPIRSTEAAVRMLAELYEQYQDWSLVLAAYNAGPGRVNKAIRYAGTKDFWTLMEYLPQETQRYVPAFIAAAYVVNFHDLHDLQPRYPAHHLQDTRVLRVQDYMTFRDIAYVTGISLPDIQYLNPSFLQGVIPKSSIGHYLVLPAEAVPAFRKFQEERSTVQVKVPAGSFRTTYVVTNGDTLGELAEMFHCTQEDLIRWNNLSGPDITVNQELLLYLSREFLLTKV